MFCAYTRPRCKVSVYRTIGPPVCGCTACFMSDLLRNPEDRFSYDVAY